MKVENYSTLKVKVKCFSVEKQKQPILFISKNSRYFSVHIITYSLHSPQMTGMRGQVNFAYIFCVWKMTFFLLLYLLM